MIFASIRTGSQFISENFKTISFDNALHPFYNHFELISSIYTNWFKPIGFEVSFQNDTGIQMIREGTEL